MNEQAGNAPMPDDEAPIDDASTTRPHAGLIVKDARELPGLALMGLALAAFVGCLTAAAAGGTGWAVGSGVAAVTLAVVGIASVVVQRRRVIRPTAGRHRATTT